MVFSADSQIYRNLSAKNAEGMPFFRGNADNGETDADLATGDIQLLRTPTGRMTCCLQLTV